MAVTTSGKVSTWRPIWSGASPSWAQIGNPIGTSATRPTLVYRPAAVQGQQLFLGYLDSQPRVSAFDGNGWSNVGGGLGPMQGTLHWGGLCLSTNASGGLAALWGEVGVGSYTSPTMVTKVYNR
ncbi:MAG: hypothetical protein QM767_16035 [Anaeromyxobacter sp.]